MQRFTQLFFELDATNSTLEKVQAVERYFVSAEPASAAWGLYFLTGRKIKRVIASRLLRDWAGIVSHTPGWLLDECYEAVGDLAETLALVLPPAEATTSLSLHELVETRLLPLKDASIDKQRRLVEQTWRELDERQRLVWHKLITGEFRVGVARTLVARALANVAAVPPAVMAHRLMGHWAPTAEDYARLLSGADQATNVAQPYPFFLASPLDKQSQELGELGDWQLEWKWDGIRAQLIRRAGQVLLWSRGEELITDRFPEIVDAGRHFADGLVLDGEVMAWSGDEPLPFATLQRRIGRKHVDARLQTSAPTAFVAYDLLEYEGRDVRQWSLVERRRTLEEIVAQQPRGLALRLSPLVEAASWEEVGRMRDESRARRVEGLMLKRRASPYGVGRTKGDWWKWKIAPYAIDAVLMYAQRGHGRRASLYTDYTFGVWDGEKLAPIAKAYSGLTDKEIKEVDAFVRGNAIEKFGPVRAVPPELVFELHFEGIQVSKRHKVGLAVRFPRIGRWRRDKTAAEADTLATLDAMAQMAQPRGKPPVAKKSTTRPLFDL